MRTLVLKRVDEAPELIFNNCTGGFVLPNLCENPSDVGAETKDVGVVTVKVTGTLIWPAVTDWMDKEPV